MAKTDEDDGEGALVVVQARVTERVKAAMLAEGARMGLGESQMVRLILMERYPVTKRSKPR